MIFSRTRALVLLLLVPALLFGANARKQPTRPQPSADAYRGAIVVDASTGNVLFEDNADIVSPPASMTKLMTFAVVADKLAAGALTLSTPVRITPLDASMGGTQVYLDPRETFSVEELIYAMMIQSANDAAHALARATAGSASAFVALMNAKAQSLGMSGTTFVTPHGLPPASRKIADDDLTTPRDFALLSRYLLQNTDVLKYTAIKNRTFGEGVRAKLTAMSNHNNLLGKVAGVDGLKTGFTNGAGFCLSATAERDGRRVIVVTMGAAQASARDLKVAELIDLGFAALPPKPSPPQIPPQAKSPPVAAPSTPREAPLTILPAPAPGPEPIRVQLPKRNSK